MATTPTHGNKRDSSEEEIPLFQWNPHSTRAGIVRKGRLKQEGQSRFFHDGVTSVDFVLTFEENWEMIKIMGSYDNSERENKRDNFVRHCKTIGLLVEYQDHKESVDNKTDYWKIHGTHIALLKGAQNLRLRMPIEKNNLRSPSKWERLLDMIRIEDPFKPTVPDHLKKKRYFTIPFLYDKRYIFLGHNDEENFFTSAQRGAIVYSILQTIPYGEDYDDVGLNNLLQAKVFTAAFLLHESDYKLKEEQKAVDMTMRHYLYYNWCHWKSWCKRQPFDQINMYFGVKVAYYFNWLEFYTLWLIPASTMGLIVFLVGLYTMNATTVSEICNPDLRYDFYECPSCDTNCDFRYLTDSCFLARISKLFDNGATIFFAIFMSFWAVLFLEFWKRQQSFMQHEWDVFGLKCQKVEPRPQFKSKIEQRIATCTTMKAKEKYFRSDPVLNQREYVQPHYQYYPKIVCSICVLLTMITLSMACLISVMLYQQALIIRLHSASGVHLGILLVPISSGIIQFVLATMLGIIYKYIARKLTEWELHRIQTDFDDNLTAKFYAFQFVNFYSPLFYIALIKGNMVGYPGAYTRLLGQIRFSDCDSSDCLLNVTIYLLIFMIGKLFTDSIGELSILHTQRFLRWHRPMEAREDQLLSSWERDNNLTPVKEGFLHYEYLELIIQYGFVALFVAALPLAPVIALLNNLIQIRVDAYKLVVLLRRYVPQQVDGIGFWYNILAVVTKIGVLTNALFIGFSTNFIPMSVFFYGGYRIPNSSESYTGYVNWTHSSFSVGKLLDGHAFPAFSVQRLPLYNGSQIIQENGKPFLYLPYIDFQCLNDKPGVSLPLSNFSNIIGLPKTQLTGGRVYVTMREDNYINMVEMNENVRNYILVPGTSNFSTGACFNENLQCRLLTFARDGGIVKGQSRTIFEATFWRVLLARLGFVALFEHFVFVLSALIDFIIPDTPGRIKNEIKRQKLLSNKAVLARKSEKLHARAKIVTTFSFKD